MPASSKQTVFISGKIGWAKVLGKPVFNKYSDQNEWSFEITPDEESLQRIIKAGLTEKVKGKGYNIGTKGQHADRNPFLQFKKPEFNKDGEPNQPIRVYNAEDEEWDHSELIGNDSTVDVKIDARDYGPGKPKGVYPAAIRVTDHVPYKSSEFGGMDRDEAPTKPAKAKKKDTFKEDFGLPVDDLDDEMPV